MSLPRTYAAWWDDASWGLHLIRPILEARVLDERTDPYEVEQIKMYVVDILGAIEEREQRDGMQEKIRQLEITDGRTPEEAQLYVAKAQQLREKAER